MLKKDKLIQEKYYEPNFRNNHFFNVLVLETKKDPLISLEKLHLDLQIFYLEFLLGTLLKMALTYG